MNITLTKQALKQMSVLDKTIKQRIFNGVGKLPDGDVKKLKGYSNFYRLRIGDYRVLYNITDGDIVITDVLPRGEAYKNI